MRTTRLGRRCPTSLILAALLMGVGAPALAQDSTLTPDARVRVMAVGTNRWVIGKLLAPPRDTVTLLEGDSGETKALATASLARFEVSRGRRKQTGRGAWIGAVTGGVISALLGAVTYEECSGFCVAPDPGRGGTALLGGLLGGVFGLGVGALVGTAFTGDRWTPVPQPWGS